MPKPEETLGHLVYSFLWQVKEEVLEVILDYFLKYFCEINISYYRSILDIEKQK